MVASVSRQPDPMAGGASDAPKPPIPAQDSYRIAVEEYRFQAQFNWVRTQYLFGFCAAVLVAGVSLIRPSGIAAALAFAVGAVAAVLTTLAIRTQHDYYRSARDRVQRIEDAIGIPADQRLDTTRKRGRWISVNQVIYVLLAAIAAADVVGAIVAIMS